MTADEVKRWKKYVAEMRQIHDMLTIELVDAVARDAPRRVEIRASGVVAERMNATLDQDFNDLLATAGAAYLEGLNEKGDEPA